MVLSAVLLSRWFSGTLKEQELSHSLELQNREKDYERKLRDQRDAIQHMEALLAQSLASVAISGSAGLHTRSRSPVPASAQSLQGTRPVMPTGGKVDEADSAGDQPAAVMSDARQLGQAPLSLHDLRDRTPHETPVRTAPSGSNPLRTRLQPQGNALPCAGMLLFPGT